jgi:fibronectin type 3 domain-containing protein
VAIASLLIACGGPSGSATNATGTTAGTATLAWDAVTAPSLQGYRVYYGTFSGRYLQSPGQGLPVGNDTTTYQVTGLSTGATYYFAVTAYDLEGESDYSNEVFKVIP